jgi:hypothetical protein
MKAAVLRLLRQLLKFQTKTADHKAEEKMMLPLASDHILNPSSTPGGVTAVTVKQEALDRELTS